MCKLIKNKNIIDKEIINMILNVGQINKNKNNLKIR